MSFSFEGMLSGVGKGLVASADILDKQYALDFQAKESELQYQRQDALLKLGNKFNVDAATTLHTRNQDNRLEDRTNSLDDRTHNEGREDTVIGMKHRNDLALQDSALAKATSSADLVLQKQITALDAALANEEISPEIYKTAKIKLLTGLDLSEKKLSALDQANLDKTVAETEVIKAKGAPINSDVYKTAVTSVMDKKGWDKLSVGEQMQQTADAYSAGMAQINGSGKPSAADGNTATFIATVGKAANGDATAVKYLQAIVSSGEIPKETISAIEKSSGVSINSILKDYKPKDAPKGTASVLDGYTTGGIPVPMSGGVPSGKNAIDWKNAEAKVTKANGGPWRGTQKDFYNRVNSEYNKLLPQKLKK